jgi:hypothetical protein
VLSLRTCANLAYLLLAFPLTMLYWSLFGFGVMLGTLFLLSAPAVPLFLVVVRVLSVLPLPVGRLVVSTNAALLPLCIGWLALGRHVWMHSKRAGG